MKYTITLFNYYIFTVWVIYTMLEAEQLKNKQKKKTSQPNMKKQVAFEVQQSSLFHMAFPQACHAYLKPPNMLQNKSVVIS